MSLALVIADAVNGFGFVVQVLAALAAAAMLAFGVLQRATAALGDAPRLFLARLPARIVEGALGLLALAVPVAWLATIF
jgi:hypothetical protein